MRLAVVVQRYGEEVVGGAELHARWIAQRLAARGHEVTVLTTCALDYLSWVNEYDPGESAVGGVRVLRFPVARLRVPESFDPLSNRVHFERHTDAEERRWMEEHGPVTPGLLEHLRAHHGVYDAIVFFSYRYWTTFHGLRVAPAKSLLVPTAEEDPAIRFRMFREVFRLPAAYAFNTPEERDLLQEVAGGALPGEVVGVGIEEAPTVAAAEIRARLDLLGDYVLYVGRIEQEKGVSRLFDHFLRYVQESRPHLSLALVGKRVLPIPVHPGITHLGILSDSEKLSALAAARVFVHPSPFESLSMALLEAWTQGRPALVNGDCAVLRGQVLRAGGGLYYAGYEEFRETLDWLLDHPAEADDLGRSGRAYYQANYAWDVVMGKYDRLLERVASALRA